MFIEVLDKLSSFFGKRFVLLFKRHRALKLFDGSRFALLTQRIVVGIVRSLRHRLHRVFNELSVFAGEGHGLIETHQTDGLSIEREIVFDVVRSVVCKKRDGLGRQIRLRSRSRAQSCVRVTGKQIHKGGPAHRLFGHCRIHAAPANQVGHKLCGNRHRDDFIPLVRTRHALAADQTDAAGSTLDQFPEFGPLRLQDRRHTLMVVVNR